MGWLAEALDISLRTANKFYAWGWRGSLIGAAITAISVGFLYWGTRVRDRDFEHNVAELNSEAGKARERAAQLEERAAGLEKETADAKLQQERIKAALAWRTLTPETIAKLTENLSKNPSAVNIKYTDGDPEALFLAIQIANILGKAKWQVGMGALRADSGHVGT